MSATTVLFFASGALALGYQVLWSRYVLDFIGVSAYSYATVLAFFMAGLALGSAILGRWADRVHRPLQLFAGLELAIGLYSLVYRHLSAGAEALYARLVGAEVLSAGGVSGLGAKVLVAGALLLPPTILMGGTYPAMLRQATENLSALGRQAARLYAANAAGAVLGALLMAFVCLPGLGMRRSLLLLGGLNALTAAVAFGLARTSRPRVAPEEERGDTDKEGRRLSGLLPCGLLLVAGFVSFAGEIAWTRYFSLVLGSSTYSFAIIVAAFIAGIAAGSAWLTSRASSIARPLAFFGWTQLAAGAAILVPLPLYPYLPWVFLQYAGLLSARPGAFFLYEAGKALFCFVVLLPATFLMGLSLPLVLKEQARRLSAAGAAAGRVYAWNTWGNVLGALVAGHVLLPRLGMEGLLRVCALLAALVGFAAVWLRLPDGRARRRALVLSTAAVCGLAALPMAAGRWDTRWFVLGAFRRVPPTSFAETRAIVQAHEVRLFKDDPAANVMVFRKHGARGWDYTLSVNAKPDASSYGDMPTEALSGHLPLLLAPEPRRVLLVGYGSGVTAGAILRHPVSRLDVVDVVAAVPEASSFFSLWNGDPLIHPHCRLIVDDARAYLAYTRETYDVVISEPSNPWTAGTGSLFSIDFYRRAQRVLAPQGIYVQWIQTYELADETFAAVVRSFRTAFPHVYAFQGNSSDLLLIGSASPLAPRWSDIVQRFSRPSVREQLGRLGVTDPAALLHLQTYSPSTIDLIAALTSLENDDDLRLLEYRAPRDLFARATVSLRSRMDERLSPSPSLFWPSAQEDRPLLSALRLLADERIRCGWLMAGYQIAAFRLQGRPALEAAGLLPWAFRVTPPPSPDTLGGELMRLVAERQIGGAQSLMAAYSSSILIEAAASPVHGAVWQRHIEEWRGRGLSSWPPARQLWIDVLMAKGDLARAGEEIEDWISEPAPPSFEWALERACRIDRGRLCSAALARYRGSPGAAPVVKRLEELRRDLGRSS